MFWLKCLKQRKGTKKRPPFTILVFFLNKGFDYINLSSILHLGNVKYLFPHNLKIDEPPSVVYNFGKTIRNKILNSKEFVSSIDKDDNVIHGRDILECNCQQHKDFADENHGHV